MLERVRVVFKINKKDVIGLEYAISSFFVYFRRHVKYRFFLDLGILGCFEGWSDLNAASFLELF